MKNFFLTLRCYKLSSFLNIFGLSIAFAAFIVMMMQVNFEWGYGKSDPNHREIFRVETPDHFRKGDWSCQIDGGEVKHLTQSEPRIKGYYYNDGIDDVEVFLLEDSLNTVKNKFYQNFTNPADFFHFEFVQGGAKDLMQPNKVIIPISLAKQLFGNRGAIGEILKVKGEYFHKNREQEVVGVYRDFPENATLRNSIFGGPDSRRINPKTGEIFDAHLYIRTTTSDTAQILDNLYQYNLANNKYNLKIHRSRLTPVGETYMQVM